MSKTFEGKVAIVTGGGSGIGLEAARQFVARGGKVVIVGRSAEKLEAAAQLIDANTGNVATVAGDIGELETAEHAVGVAEERFGAWMFCSTMQASLNRHRSWNTLNRISIAI